MFSALAQFVSSSSTNPGVPLASPANPTWSTTQVTYLDTVDTAFGPLTQWRNATSIRQSLPLTPTLPPVIANLPHPTLVAATDHFITIATKTGPFRVLTPAYAVALFAPPMGIIVGTEERRGRVSYHYLANELTEWMPLDLPREHQVLYVLKDLPVLLSRCEDALFVWTLKEDQHEDHVGLKDFQDGDDDPIGHFVRSAMEEEDGGVKEPKVMRKVLTLTKVYELPVQSVECVDAFLAHSLHGKLVLCIVSGGVLTGLSFAVVDGEVGNMTPQFRIMDVESAAPVMALRMGLSCLDIVVSHAGGNMSLFMGRNRLCSVRLGECSEVNSERWRFGGKVCQGVGSQFSVRGKDGLTGTYSLEGVTFKSPLVNRCLAAVSFVFEMRGILLRIATLYHEILGMCGGAEGEDADWDIFGKAMLKVYGEGRKSRDFVTMDADYPDQVSANEEHWLGLLASDFHSVRSRSVTLGPPLGPRTGSNPELAQVEGVRGTDIDTLRSVLFALHLLYEDQKLSALTNHAAERLATLNVRLAQRIGAVNYIDHYRRDCIIPDKFSPLEIYPEIVCDHGPVPSMIDFLASLACGEPSRTQYCDVLDPDDLPQTQTLSLMATWRAQSPVLTSARVVKYYKCLFREDDNCTDYVKRAEAVLLAMVEDGLSLVELDALPFGIALPLQDALYACRQHPDTSWPFKAFTLIGREDLFNYSDFELRKASKSESEIAGVTENRALLQVQAAAASLMQTEESSVLQDTAVLRNPVLDGRQFTSTFEDTGCYIGGHLHQLRFSSDKRVEEVGRVLRSTDPVIMTPPVAPTNDSGAEFDMAAEQRRKLGRLVRKRYAAPVGRGAFTLRTFVPSDPTKPLPVPSICTTGVLLGQKGSKVNLTDIDLLTVEWGEFHNGVAAGLRIVASSDDKDSESGKIFTRSWIVNHRPSETLDDPAHAGMLLALGLAGYLPKLRTADFYEYLLPRHELTSIGLMLGLALGNIGSMEEKVTKMLCLHIKYFNAAGFAIPDFNVSVTLQTTAVLGLGFLHRGSCEHVILEGLFAELARRPQPGDNIDDREGLSLAAGISIGLVCLGTGSAAFDLSDKRLVDRLVLYANGGPGDAIEEISSHMDSLSIKPDVSANHERSNPAPADSEASRIKEGKFASSDVVSPGALLAIGLIYLKTNDRRMADRIIVPETLYDLDRAHSVHVLLRILVRFLILWDDIEASRSWIYKSLPALLRPAPKGNSENVFDLRGEIMIGGTYWDQDVDVDGLLQARFFSIAGACTAIALKYAGSNDTEAVSLLTSACEAFEQALLYEEQNEGVARWGTMTCLGSSALAVSIVAAGSGNLELFRMLRRLRKRRCLGLAGGKYGYYIAIHMAIGFLFMGGGCQTFGTENTGVAGLLCAIYPRFPEDVYDNQFHLQAMRHLYVLATEPRYLETRDVDTGLPCCVDVEIGLRHGGLMKARAPCILPASTELENVAVVSERYWPKTVRINPAVPGRGWFSNTEGQVLFVKRRTGHLPYSSDPKGSKGIMARSICRPRPTTDTSNYFAQVEHLVRAFSADAQIVAFVKHYCGCPSRGTVKIEENEEMRRLVDVLFECLSNDKAEAVRVYMHAERAIDAVVQGDPSPSAVGSLKVVSRYMLWSNGSRRPMVSMSYLARLIRMVWERLEYWELQKAVATYVKSGGKVWGRGKGSNGRDISADVGVVLRLGNVPGPGDMSQLMDGLRQAVWSGSMGEGIWPCFGAGVKGMECVIGALSADDGLESMQ